MIKDISRTYKEKIRFFLVGLTLITQMTLVAWITSQVTCTSDMMTGVVHSSTVYAALFCTVLPVIANTTFWHDRKQNHLFKRQYSIFSTVRYFALIFSINRNNADSHWQSVEVYYMILLQAHLEYIRHLGSPDHIPDHKNRWHCGTLGCSQHNVHCMAFYIFLHSSRWYNLRVTWKKRKISVIVVYKSSPTFLHR